MNDNRSIVEMNVFLIITKKEVNVTEKKKGNGKERDENR